MAKWYSSVVVQMLDKGTEGLVKANCEHFQVLVTNLLQKHWDCQQNWKEAVMHGAHRYKTMFEASLEQDCVPTWPSWV